MVAGKNAARFVGVSGDHNSNADAQRLLPPSQQTVLQLPFAGGQAWQVLQPFDNPDPNGSHNDSAAFCWDFFLSGVGDPLASTCGSPLYASGKGTVQQATDAGGGPTALDGPNVMNIQMAEGELATYMHVQTGSITDILGPNPVGKPVNQGQHIARAGTRGQHNCHLHFALTSPTRTIPAAFSNYELFDPASQTWKPVALGMPRLGEIFRRPEPAGCAALRAQIESLEAEKAGDADYGEVGPTQKPAITHQINQIQNQINAAKAKATAAGCLPC
jgi:murein DD-endopeptidase MepM/ murein hydrolase activator NlpD